MSPAWLSDEQAAAYEHDALASWPGDEPAAGAHPCHWCGGSAEPGEIQLSATKWAALCRECVVDLVTAFSPGVEVTP